MDPLQEQLNRLETKIDLIVARVDHVERKASFWGAVSSIVVTLTGMLLGCL
jgi:hypothetical protein